MISDTTLAFAEKVASAFLGADALYRSDPNGDQIGLVIMNLAGNSIAPEYFENHAVAIDRFLELQRMTVELPEVDRRLFYQQLCHTTVQILKWLRDGLPFSDQIRDFLHVTGVPPSDQDLDYLRSEIHRQLTQMGFSGDLQSQCSAWEERNRVPPDEVQGVMEELMDIAWERTADIIGLPESKEDGMKVVTVSSDYFNARCDYQKRTVEINIDPVLTNPGLKHLVAHEAYPGHYVQFRLRESLYHAGKATAEGLFSMLKSPSSCMFEGVADHGIYTLDWVEGDGDRVMAWLTRYRAAIGAAAAWRLHALKWEHKRTVEWLRTANLLGGDAWVVQRMGYLTPPQRGMHVWSYWQGEPRLHKIWQAVDVDQRGEFYNYLYSRLHSPQSVELFLKD